ncbi:MAG: hypothetical protein GTN93_33970, partial [Anaerolineae bacterium]|nr:hypothetical protein [Anaerolineae bacterium]
DQGRQKHRDQEQKDPDPAPKGGLGFGLKPDEQLDKPTAEDVLAHIKEAQDLLAADKEAVLQGLCNINCPCEPCRVGS